MPRLAIFNQKGGVGKTTTTLNLAAASMRHNRPPLLLDLDPQGHLSSIHGQVSNQVERSLFSFYQDHSSLAGLELPWPEIGSLIPSHQQLIKVDSIYGKGPTILNRLRQGLALLEEEKGERVTLIDCCPYVGVLSLNAIFAADRLLIPVATDFLSLQAAFHMARTLDILEPVMKRRVERRYVLTRFDRRRRMSGDIRQRLEEAFGEEVCRTAIAENVAVAESPSLNRDVFTHAFASNGAQDYLALHDELRACGFL